MSAKNETKSDQMASSTTEAEMKKIDEYGHSMYAESAKAVREVGAKVALSIVAAIVIWLFAELVFMPLAADVSEELLGYPMDSIVAFVVVIALAMIVFSIFVYVKRLSAALSGIMVYHFGKAGGETKAESYKNYATMLDGILYVVVISLAYLLFKNPLGDVHAAIPAILLLLIVIWAIFTLWRSFSAISSEIGRYTSKFADELEKQVGK